MQVWEVAVEVLVYDDVGGMVDYPLVVRRVLK